MYSHFVLPFIFALIFLLGVIGYKFCTWYNGLTSKNKHDIKENILSTKSFLALWRIIKDYLFHFRFFRHNFLLGYMYCAIFLGCLSIIISSMVCIPNLLGGPTPFYLQTFYRYFFPVSETEYSHFFANLSDSFLLFALSGVFLAVLKRFRFGARLMGFRYKRRESFIDFICFCLLILIFPLRLLAESISSGLYDSGGFLTGFIGSYLNILPFIVKTELPAWWSYSIAVSLFLILLPFSRYSYLFSSIPHTFLRSWGILPTLSQNSSDCFQVNSCSRCGLCIDNCQLQTSLGVNNVQGIYFLRDKRNGKSKSVSSDNCLMCGRCEIVCPSNISIDTLRLSERHKLHGNSIPEDGLNFLTHNEHDTQKSFSISDKKSRVGYFSGCMTDMSPSIKQSMLRIFSHAKANLWLADDYNPSCCGRPMMLSGETKAAEKMMEYNKKLFAESGISVLVSSCPMCVRSLKKDYNLSKLGIKVIHHTQYIAELIKEGKIECIKTDDTVSYHDPCELGRGLSVYNEPRYILKSISNLKEIKPHGRLSLCCGHSPANNSLSSSDKNTISGDVLSKVTTGTLVTSCPQCKDAFFINEGGIKVLDICELVSKSLK